MSNPVLISIQVGTPQTYGRPDAEHPCDKSWTSAIFKMPVVGRVAVGQCGVAGDSQADREHHGGEDKAVLCYSADHYPGWRETLGPDSSQYGGFGENLTISGLTEELVCIGDLWQVGADVLLQVSQPRQPCWKLARRWRIEDLVAQVQQNGRSGWYCRVLAPGCVEAGQRLVLRDRPHPHWTIAAASQVMHHQKHDATAALELAAVPELARSWQGSLAARAARLGSNT
jgi:MOSC domain-containing protein YiiM